MNAFLAVVPDNYSYPMGLPIAFKRLITSNRRGFKVIVHDISAAFIMQ